MEFYDRRTAPKRADAWFVYALVDSRHTENIRYIGVTNNPKARLSMHLSQAPKEGWKKSRWIGSVIEEGADVLIGVMASGLSQNDAMNMEISLIAAYRATGAPLMNLTDGGDGVKGQVQSAETRAKKSASLKGRVHSPEATAMRADALRGRKHSEEHRANMSAAHLKRYQIPGAKERQRDGTIARFADPNERARYADLTKARFERDGERERHSKIMRAFNDNNPDVVEKRRVAQRRCGPQSNNKTGFKGVFIIGKNGKISACIKTGEKPTRLGYFGSAEEAARAYDQVAYAAWGKDCYLNFPAEIAA
jgi:predicted GIY-YIG superfamily endonuclease